MELFLSEWVVGFGGEYLECVIPIQLSGYLIRF